MREVMADEQYGSKNGSRLKPRTGRNERIRQNSGVGQYKSSEAIGQKTTPRLTEMGV
jgi:hypothetical protein